MASDDRPPDGSARLAPMGEVLRATWDAENHDSLGGDLTGLMLELAHVDDPAPPAAPHAPPPSRLRRWLRRAS